VGVGLWFCWYVPPWEHSIVRLGGREKVLRSSTIEILCVFLAENSFSLFVQFYADTEEKLYW